MQTKDTEWLVNQIAHALRNPVFAASLQAELLVTKCLDPAAEKVLVTLRRLDAIISEMLLFGRPADVKAQELDPAGLLQEVINAYRRSGDHEPAEIDLRLPDSQSRVAWDRHAVQLILERLLDNAVENSSPPHHIEVLLRRSSDSDIEIRVVDQGEGIPEEIRRGIFLPFFPQHEGRAGLGLAVCLKFARALGGDLELSSEVGRGTEACVRLPVKMPS